MNTAERDDLLRELCELNAEMDQWVGQTHRRINRIATLVEQQCSMDQTREAVGRARQTLTELGHRWALRKATEEGRARQLTRWHADDQAAEAGPDPDPPTPEQHHPTGHGSTGQPAGERER